MSCAEIGKYFERVIAIKYDVAKTTRLELFAQYHRDIDTFYQNVLERTHSKGGNRTLCQSNISD